MTEPFPGLEALGPEAAARTRTAAEHVEAVLKAAILEGRLAGGTALRQEELAARFGLSRMPVREALRRLEAQALVDVLPHRGAVVTEISARDAADGYAIRRALEPAALRLSIPRLTAADLAEAAQLIAAMDSEPETALLGQLNRRFHMALYRAAGHARMLAMVEQELAGFDRYLRFHLAAQGREHMAQDDHRAMLAAAGAGDAAAAVAVLERHLDQAAATIAAFFARRAAVPGDPRGVIQS
ncbi:GntR family transcriptional regulator [Pseudoroseomonas cervicalis]|uniref:Transcriptional regulator, GntR family n=1 Tax=Pseudoroseomonas cervicalis ATCC 49957 TaxID=525371 RepID=D5RPB1_9PROT|nr:GntR family transcriptional regulator [Pseudoroseomonas cervicalis]EFH10863.1 transcriptional regulator, GntR family [Pseudoroseomonas cervicalis ATCC 49957]